MDSNPSPIGAGRLDAIAGLYRPDDWGPIGSITRCQYQEGYAYSPDPRALEAKKRYEEGKK